MDDILNTIGDTIGGFFSNPVVELALQAIAVYFVILWLAAAYWAFRDMQQRSENPVLPYLAAALIILFTPVFFLFGVIVYRIIRPHEKIGEVYERNLAEEALLAEVESIKTCPSCRRRVNDEWIICPTCRTRLNRVCANCGRLVGLDWSLCAWCGKDFERGDLAAYEPIAAPVSGRLEPTAPPAGPRPSSTRADRSRPPAAVREPRAHRAPSRSLDRAAAASGRPTAIAPDRPLHVQPRGPCRPGALPRRLGRVRHGPGRPARLVPAAGPAPAARWLFLVGLRAARRRADRRGGLAGDRADRAGPIGRTAVRRRCWPSAP